MKELRQSLGTLGKEEGKSSRKTVQKGKAGMNRRDCLLKIRKEGIL